MNGNERYNIIHKNKKYLSYIYYFKMDGLGFRFVNKYWIMQFLLYANFIKILLSLSMHPWSYGLIDSIVEHGNSKFVVLSMIVEHGSWNYVDNDRSLKWLTINTNFTRKSLNVRKTPKWSLLDFLMSKNICVGGCV